MPLPRTLATAGHRDLDLRVVAGTWPAEVTRELAALPSDDLREAALRVAAELDAAHAADER